MPLTWPCWPFSAAREAGRPADATRILDEAPVNLSPRKWPVPVLRFLGGTITQTALLQAAVSDRQQAEVHTFLGLERLHAGDRAGALLHLRWANDHGAPGSIAADVATARLMRLESTTSGSQGKSSSGRAPRTPEPAVD